MQISNDGKQAWMRLTPSYNDESQGGIFNFGDKFSKVSLELPPLMGNTFSIRFLRLANVSTTEVVFVVAIKYDGMVDESWKDWNVIYESHVFDGQGGGRALKDPFRPWVLSALNQGDKIQVTIRMDKQPASGLKEGEHFGNARITEIVDYAI
jgi:hypothetical protein